MAIYGLGELGNNPSNVAKAIAQGNSVDLSPIPNEVLLGIGNMLGSLGADVSPVEAEINRRASGANTETTNLSSRSLFAKQMYQLPPEAQEMLNKGKWQISHHRIYSSQVATGLKHLDMFNTGDSTQIGLTNVVQAKTLTEDYFFLTGINVYGAELTAATTEALKAASWGKITPEIYNGEWKFTLENTTYFDKTPLTCFNQTCTDKEIGSFRLDTTKMLYPNRLIDFELDFAAPISDSKNYGVRVELVGIRTRKA